MCVTRLVGKKIVSIYEKEKSKKQTIFVSVCNCAMCIGWGWKRGVSPVVLHPRMAREFV